MSDESTSPNGTPGIDPSEVDANELAQNMSQATDEQLSELMSGPMREQILNEIFRRMEEHLCADFLRLVTGNAPGPMLFMNGRLTIEGDMMFAASAAALFTIPTGQPPRLTPRSAGRRCPAAYCRRRCPRRTSSSCAGSSTRGARMIAH